MKRQKSNVFTVVYAFAQFGKGMHGSTVSLWCLSNKNNTIASNSNRVLTK